MKKLTAFELTAIMLCVKCFSMMIYFPFSYSNISVYMLGVLISTAIQAILVLPAVIFSQTFENDNPCTLQVSKNKAAGYAVTAAYLLFFLTAAFFTIGSGAYFMDYFFSQYIPRIMMVVCITAAAVYLAYLNLSTLGKTSVYAILLFGLLVIMVVAGSLRNLYFTNFHLAEDIIVKPLFEAAGAELSRNSSLAAFAFLLPDVCKNKKSGKSDAPKSVWQYLIIKTAALEIILAFLTIILGDYAVVAELPFFSLAAYSNTQIIERYDAMFIFVWIFVTIVRLAVYLHCAVKCLKIFLPKCSGFACSLGSGVAAGAAALLILIAHKWESLAYLGGGQWAVIVFAAVIPLVQLIFIRRGGFDSNAKKAANVQA